MASWLDYLDSERQKLWSQPRQFTTRQPSLHVGNRTSRMYDPWEVSRPNPKSFSSVISTGAAKSTYTPAAPPERFDVSLPMGNQPPAPPQPSTEGDFFGSVGAAFNSAAQGLNIANVIPWIMERSHEFAQQLADSNQGNLIGAAAAPAADATGAFLGAFESMSNVAGPIIEAFPNWVRDSQLNDRAKLYRAIAAGADKPDYGASGPLSGPLGTLGQLWSLASNPVSAGMALPMQRAAAENAPGSALEEWSAARQAGPLSGLLGQTVTAEGNQYELYRDVLLRSMDPDAKQNAQEKIAVLLDTIDLPESVKQAIAERPSLSDEDLAELVESAEEGKQWSYQPGISGLAQNLGTPLVFYLAEAKAGLGVAGGVSALGASAGGGSALGGAIATGVTGATRGVSLAAKIQKYAMLSGASTAALTTTLDAVARYQGNQAAVDWWDRVSQPSEFAENWNVQLISGFTVNPFSAAGALKRGVIRVGKGADAVVLNRTLGKRLLTYYNDDDLIYGQIAKMYKLGSAEEARAFATDFYETRGQVYDEVVGLAADHVLNKLPHEERLALAATYHGDPGGLTKAVLGQYGDQVWDALKRHPDEIAQRFYESSWAYHQYPGAFNRDIAALNARDYRVARDNTAALRDQLDAVVGYQDYLAPEGQQLLRRQIDALPGDAVAVAGKGGLQDFIRQFPAMRKYWQGLVDPKSPTVSKAAMETMLQRAELDYNAAAKQNPVRVQTGADPVLRPDSPRRLFDEAQALGTDLPTMRALDSVNLTNPKPEHVAPLRAFLAEKIGITPEEAAVLTPQEVVAKAVDYRLTTTEPWVAAGERIVAAEKRITTLREELRRLHAKPTRVRTMYDREAIGRAETELAQLHTLTREAGDPIRPFSADVALEESAARAADRVRGMNPDKLTKGQAKWLSDYVTADWNVRGRLTEAGRLEGRPLYNAAMEIASRHPSTVGRDVRWAELAARKVAAQSVLDQLGLIDDTAATLGLVESWPRLVRKVEGTYQWTGGKPPMSPGLRRTLSGIFDRQGHPSLSRDILTMGDEEAWVSLGDAVKRESRFLDRLSRTQRGAIDKMQAAGESPFNTNADTIAEQAIRSGKVTSTEDFIGQVVRLAEAREELLGAGRDAALRRVNLKRTAGIDVPAEYVTAAENDIASHSYIYDPEFEAITHPQNVAEVQRILGAPGELYPALGDLVQKDPLLLEKVYGIASRKGVPVDDLLSNPSHAPLLRELVPADFEAPTPGVVKAETALDDLVLQGDREAIAQRTQSLREAAYAQHEPIPTTRARAQAAFRGTERPSTIARRRLVEAGTDLTASPSAAIMADPANQIAMDVISVVNHGVVGTKPATVGYLHTLLREIEDGGASRMGFGASAQADAKRVLNALIDDAAKGAKRQGFRPGEFAAGLDPAMLGPDDLALARALKVEEATSALRRTLEHDVIRAGQEAESQAANLDLGVAKGGTPESGGAIKPVPAQTIKNPLEGLGSIRYEPGDPLGTLQYGLKKRPQAAVVMELSRVPGLAEEFVAKRFQPWAERAWTAHTRQAYNYLFGAHPNEAVVGAVRENFLERAARQGVDGEVADAIWKRWRNEAGLSRDVEIRVNEKGVRQHLPGDNPLYATIANIPNGRMDQWAHQAVDEFLNTRQARGAVDPAYRDMAHSIDYANLFRESSSNMKRWLKGESVKIGAVSVPSPVRNETLGMVLSKAYGAVAHNKAATTMYYWFRFGLDVRFHAMNFFEAQILYAGRAGLKAGEIDKGLLGQTEGFLRRMDTDFVNNTGYATSRSRFAYAYRTFLKEQPDALRGRIKGLQSENPELMDRALRELADADPQLADMIANTGGTPDGWVQAMDEWHGKMLKAGTEEEGVLVIDEAIAEAIRKEPAMAEVYSALGEANKGLWSDVRGTFYGNASRTRAERFLNSYLLFWPLSYQIKASKWMMRVLFDSAGGLPTNAAGAVMLERAAESHQQLLATEPKYQDWYEKHETLVFMAQMFMPVTPDSLGVSLNPALRSIFFGRTKAIWDIGPIYTLKTLVPRVGAELSADMYPALRDVPGLGGVYRTLTGREPKP